MSGIAFGKVVKPVEVEAVEQHALGGYRGEERRALHRARVLKGADIRFNKGYGAYSCTVKNLTDEGAMVLMEDSSGLPAVFDFIVKGDETPRQGSVAWRSRGKAGISFV